MGRQMNGELQMEGSLGAKFQAPVLGMFVTAVSCWGDAKLTSGCL